MTAGGVLLLTVAVAVLYARAIDAPFVCDDIPSVVENEAIRRIWPPWSVDGKLGPLSRIRTNPVAGRPLVNLSFALNYRFGGLDPTGYRAINLAIHLLSSLLLWAVVVRALRLPYFHNKLDGSEGLIGFLVALVWALHPLVTEAVAYVTQRTELMVSACYLAVIFCSLRYWSAATPRSRALWGIAAMTYCWAGAASKEVMATAPIMVLLFERTFYGISIREALRRSGPLYVGLFSSWMLTIILQGGAPHSDSAGFGTGVSPIVWWFTQSKVLLMYLRLVVWPWPLSIHYEPPYLTSLGAAWMYVVPVAVLVVGALMLLWRRSSVGYLLALALAILAPTLVVPIATEIAAERRMYLPLAAILTLLVTGGYSLLRHVATARMALSATAAIATLLAMAGGVVGFVRLGEYASESLLWQKVVERDPNNATGQYNIGTDFLERNEPQRAIEHFQKAIEIRPGYARAHHNLGAAFATLGRREDATREFTRAVELEPRYAMGYVKLGLVALDAGEFASAQRNLEAALRLQPADPDAHKGMARLLMQIDKADDAIQHARAAVDSLPDDANAQNTLGAALAQKQQFIEAIDHFEAAVRLDPTLLQAQGNLMAAYASVGRAQDARATAQTALEKARAARDTAMVEQIEVFLSSYQDGADQPEASGTTSD